MKQSIALPATEDRARDFIVGSVAISALCLVLIVRERLGITDYFSVPIFRHLLIAHDYVGALLTLAILAAAYALRNTGSVTELVRLLGRHPVVVSAAAFVALSIGSLLAYHNHPLSLDEYSAFLQSEVFAAGRLAGHFPLPLIEWLMPFPFGNAFLASSPATGEVASFYMPGFALLLTPFTFLGIPWACNPALGALSLLVLHRLATEVAGSVEAGGWAILLALASPAFTVNAMSYYSMTAHLLLNALYALLLLRPTAVRALLAGIVGGLALVLHNPFPHAVYAVPWILWLLHRRDFGCVATLVAGYLPIALGLGFGWIMLTGELNAGTPIREAAGAAASSEAWRLWVEAVQKIISFPNANIAQMRIEGFAKLWLWAAPGLPILAWFGFQAAKSDTRCRLLFASAVITLLGYFFVPFDQGHGWGYRYFHSAWGVLPVLASVAVMRDCKAGSPRNRFVHIVGCAAIGSLVLGTALRTAQVEAFIDRHLGQVPRTSPGQAQAVFVDIRCGYYTIDLVQNHPLLQQKTWILVSHGPERNAGFARSLSPNARQVAKSGCGELWVLR